MAPPLRTGEPQGTKSGASSAGGSPPGGGGGMKNLSMIRSEHAVEQPAANGYRCGTVRRRPPGGLAGRAGGLAAGRPAGWLACELAGRLAGRLAGWLAIWRAGC